ncbi:hypothetical protein MRX96_020813 [Rhipicephalus microplus]
MSREALVAGAAPRTSRCGSLTRWSLPGLSTRSRSLRYDPQDEKCGYPSPFVHHFYGLQHPSPIGPILAEAGETSLLLPARGRALRLIHRMYLTPEGRRLSGQLLDCPHSGMAQRTLEYAELTPEPPYCSWLPISPHQDPGLVVTTTVPSFWSKRNTP